MQSPLLYHYHDYHEPGCSCRCYLQQTDDMHAGQYRQPNQALISCHSEHNYHWLHRLSSSSYAKLPTHLRFHHPGYNYSQPKCGCRGRRGCPRSVVHTISDMSPPAVTRCVSTVSSPFIADRQPSDVHCASSTAQMHAFSWSANCDVYSTCPDYVNTPSSSGRRWWKLLDCSALKPHEGQDVAVVHNSNDICRSLIDTSQTPAALNDAVCMYIDYLTRDNNRVIGEFSIVDDNRPQDSALSTMVNDQLYRDVFCQPSSFPTSRFREWLRVYSVDLEITDPDGRRLTQATFPGCGCEAHQVNDATAYHDDPLLSASQATGVTRTQFTSETVPYRPYMPQLQYARRSRRGRGRGTRQPSRGCPRRKSYSEYSAVSSSDRRQQMSADVPHYSSLSTVDTECNDDSAVVQFLASLQSDAAKRRCRQQEVELRHQVNSRDVESCCQDKVVEEVIDDELHVVESADE